MWTDNKKIWQRNERCGYLSVVEGFFFVFVPPIRNVFTNVKFLKLSNFLLLISFEMAFSVFDDFHNFPKSKIIEQFRLEVCIWIRKWWDYSLWEKFVLYSENSELRRVRMVRIHFLIWTREIRLSGSKLWYNSDSGSRKWTQNLKK